MNIVSRMPGNRDAARFLRMFKLSMATHSCDQRPTIVPEQLEDITNLHSSNLIGESIENSEAISTPVAR